ncbi:hypothetical protein [Deinococcus sp. UYEF24]
MTETLAAVSTIQEIIDTILQPALKALGAVAGAVLLLDSRGQELQRAGIRGDLPQARFL